MNAILAKDRKEIADAADDVIERVRELRSPKDAVTALLIAHVKITLDEDMNREKIEHMLKQYSDAFRDCYFG